MARGTDRRRVQAEVERGCLLDLVALIPAVWTATNSFMPWLVLFYARLGVVLVRDRRALLAAHHYEANYLQDAAGDWGEVSPADVSPELTKHFRGLRLWLPLQLLGLAPFRAALEEKLLLARYFYGRIQALGFEVGPSPELSVVMPADSSCAATTCWTSASLFRPSPVSKRGLTDGIRTSSRASSTRNSRSSSSRRVTAVVTCLYKAR